MSYVQGVISEVPEIILRCISRDEAALAVAQKVLSPLLESFELLHFLMSFHFEIVAEKIK